MLSLSGQGIFFCYYNQLPRAGAREVYSFAKEGRDSGVGLPFFSVSRGRVCATGHFFLREVSRCAARWYLSAWVMVYIGIWSLAHATAQEIFRVRRKPVGRISHFRPRKVNELVVGASGNETQQNPSVLPWKHKM